MDTRLEGGTTIVCSTCHDPHDNTNGSFLVNDNSTDLMCIDCHADRNVGSFPATGSHPVGVTYTEGGTYKTAPVLSATKVGPLGGNGGTVQCSSCHSPHNATTTDGNLLRQTAGETLCEECHSIGSAAGSPVGTHNGMTCADCHTPHNAGSNIYLVKTDIGGSAVIHTTSTDFGDQSGTEDGICEVCHTTTSYYLADGTGTAHNLGTDCTTCHTHTTNFAAPSCHGCHDASTPYLYPTAADGYNEGAHGAHCDLPYEIKCGECHFGLNSSSPEHQNSSVEVIFDPSGVGSANGSSPTWNGSTCSNVYCHSNGVSADRGSEGVANWGLVPMSANVYNTTPDWSTGSITACNACHEGPATMPAGPNFTVQEGNNTGLVTLSSEYPNTGAHGANTGAHNSPDQLIILVEDGTYGDPLSHSWPKVQCFWCHNNDAGAASGVPKYQGTYGTSKHVDGKTWFYPAWYGYGGMGEKTSGGKAPAYYLMDTEAEINALGSGYVWHPDPVDPERQSSMIPGLAYAWMGPTNAHCGNGKNCW